ncbi:TlpA family protein disulfide reductase [Paraglaciecola aestuariivivens]
MQKLWIFVLAVVAILAGVFVHQSLSSDFKTLDEQQLNWQNKQQKWTVVNYFAEWCAPCLREIPELNHFYQQHKQQVEVFAVNFDKLPKPKLVELQQKYQIAFPIITEFDSMPWQQPPATLPTTYILNPQGQVIKQLKGELSADKLYLTLQQLKSL